MQTTRIPVDPRDLDLLTPYNPWWSSGEEGGPRPPEFHRPLFAALKEDLARLGQILSVTGPRRIGKTTLLRQLVQALLGEGTPPERLLYYSLDDPALARRAIDGGDLLDRIVTRYAQARPKEPLYLFLDEVQRLERWELHLKKYYDLKYPIRVVISGSASSPIFKKSRESLLGRVKDFPLLPFSFREFFLYVSRDRPEDVAEVERLHETGRAVQAIMTGDPTFEIEDVRLRLPPPPVRARIGAALDRYLLEGGFPEVWGMPDWVAKQEYLYENQVKKVIYEDLVLAAEFRKPELLKRFYISLLETPGREVNVRAVAGETGVSTQQIEKYLPLLEMTDLVYHIERFRKSPLRVRKGRMKFYLVDLALRNAVLRLTERLLQDHATLGLYAENLVFLALRKWRGQIQMDYYRDRDGEVDFVVHVGPRRFVPVEVKYQESVGESDMKGLKAFTRRRAPGSRSILVTKRWEDFRPRGETFLLPLPLFLVMFD